MSGDFTRSTFDPAKAYRSVLLQQGRVTLDADWNEQAAIDAARAEMVAATTIGPVGRPKGEFAVSVDGGGNLAFSKGTIFLGGAPCRNDAACTLTTQPFRPLASTALASLPDLAPGNGSYAVVLAAWPRILTAIDDPEIRETALGGPDTAVREQWVWQVSLRRFDPPAGGSCASVGDSWRGTATPGKLTARTTEPTAPIDACLIPPTSQYRRLDNQLYRVEIHKGGTRDTATLKWSRDNGSVEAALADPGGGATGSAGPLLAMTTIGRDAESGFATDQWVELTDDLMLASGAPVPLRQIADVKPATREVELKSAAAAAAAYARHPRLRRWDHTGGDENGVPLAATVTIEDGLVVDFAAGDYKAGDYWLIPARTAIEGAPGTIDWPQDGTTPQALPSALDRRECLLTVVSWNGSKLAAVAGFDNCVPDFPPLTAITADDVSYAPQPGGPLAGADTVQEAIDILSTQTGACTIVIRPGPNWAAPLLAMPPAMDAEICFQAGMFQTPNGGIAIKSGGRLKITGAGAGTRIVNPAGETGLLITDAEALIVRDIAFETKVADANDGIGGALTARNCKSVLVEAVTVTLGGASILRGACITIAADGPPAAGASAPIVRVTGCTLSAGAYQHGILVINAARADIDQNTLIGTAGMAGTIDRAGLAANAETRRQLATLMASNIRFQTQRGRTSRDLYHAQIGNNFLVFSTPRSLAPFWDRFFADAETVREIAGPAAILAFRRAIDRIVADAGLWANEREIGALADTLIVKAGFAMRGICVAGSGLTRTRIADNAVTGFRTGVHVALSHRETSRGEPDVATAVAVSGNDIVCGMTRGDYADNADAPRRPPYGVYVGNVGDLVVADNRIGTTLPEFRAHSAIVVHGHVGNRCDIRENHVTGFCIGANLRPVLSPPSSRSWRMAGNLMEHVATMSLGAFNMINSDNVRIG